MKQLNNWRKSKEGLLLLGIVGLVLAYVFGSWAIDSGYIWQYAVAIFALIVGADNIVEFIKLSQNTKHAKGSKSKK